jgi:hypothetical protein
MPDCCHDLETLNYEGVITAIFDLDIGWYQIDNEFNLYTTCSPSLPSLSLKQTVTLYDVHFLDEPFNSFQKTLIACPNTTISSESPLFKSSLTKEVLDLTSVMQYAFFDIQAILSLYSQVKLHKFSHVKLQHIVHICKRIGFSNCSPKCNITRKCSVSLNLPPLYNLKLEFYKIRNNYGKNELMRINFYPQFISITDPHTSSFTKTVSEPANGIFALITVESNRLVLKDKSACLPIVASETKSKYLERFIDYIVFIPHYTLVQEYTPEELGKRQLLIYVMVNIEDVQEVCRTSLVKLPSLIEDERRTSVVCLVTTVTEGYLEAVILKTFNSSLPNTMHILNLRIGYSPRLRYGSVVTFHNMYINSFLNIEKKPTYNHSEAFIIIAQFDENSAIQTAVDTPLDKDDLSKKVQVFLKESARCIFGIRSFLINASIFSEKYSLDTKTFCHLGTGTFFRVPSLYGVFKRKSFCTFGQQDQLYLKIELVDETSSDTVCVYMSISDEYNLPLGLFQPKGVKIWFRNLTAKLDKGKLIIFALKSPYLIVNSWLSLIDTFHNRLIQSLPIEYHNSITNLIDKSGINTPIKLPLAFVNEYLYASNLPLYNVKMHLTIQKVLNMKFTRIDQFTFDTEIQLLMSDCTGEIRLVFECLEMFCGLFNLKRVNLFDELCKRVLFTLNNEGYQNATLFIEPETLFVTEEFDVADALWRNNCSVDVLLQKLCNQLAGNFICAADYIGIIKKFEKQSQVRVVTIQGEPLTALMPPKMTMYVTKIEQKRNHIEQTHEFLKFIHQDQ